MEIQIDDTYWLRSDERNLILARKRVTQNGENAGQESWENLQYYTSLPGFAKGALDQGVRDSEAKDLLRLVKDYEVTVAALQQLYRDLEERIKASCKEEAKHEHLSKADGDTDQA